MTTKLMMTAAALAIATGVASAQQYRADIPFAFRAGDKVLAPGSYTVYVKEAGKHVILQNYSEKQSALLMIRAGSDVPSLSAADRPVLSFDCEVGRCALTKIWTGTPGQAMTFALPRLGKDVQASATEVRLVKMNGD